MKKHRMKFSLFHSCQISHTPVLYLHSKHISPSQNAICQNKHAAATLRTTRHPIFSSIFSPLAYIGERENFICHSNEQEYHTVVTIQQNISTHVWQAARKGITPIELATLKKKEKKNKLN